MNPTYKQYDFVCEGCKQPFKKGMWYNRNGDAEGCNCPHCEHRNFQPFTEERQSGPMINTRGEDWTKKIPGDFKNFMSDFAKRHSKYGRTVNDHKSGRTEV